MAGVVNASTTVLKHVRTQEAAAAIVAVAYVSALIKSHAISFNTFFLFFFFSFSSFLGRKIDPWKEGRKKEREREDLFKGCHSSFYVGR